MSGGLDSLFQISASCAGKSKISVKNDPCGIKVEQIGDPLMQDIRYLDKLVDELAKGKAMEKILRK